MEDTFITGHDPNPCHACGATAREMCISCGAVLCEDHIYDKGEHADGCAYGDDDDNGQEDKDLG